MVSGHHMTEQFTEVKGYSALRFSLKLKPSQIRSPRYAVCTEHCLVCEKRLDTVQSVNCTLRQSHCPGGAGNSAFQWARSKTGPPHHRDAQTATWPRPADFAASYHAWSKRGGKLAGRFPCASSPSSWSSAEAQIQIHTTLLQRGTQFGKLNKALYHSMLLNRNISLIHTIIISCVCLVFKNNIIFLISQRVRRGHTNHYRA